MNMRWAKQQLSHLMGIIADRNTNIEKLERQVKVIASEARILSAKLKWIADDAEEFIRRLKETQ